MTQRLPARMQLGIGLAMVEGSVQGRTPTFQDVRAMAQTAEQIGLDSFWLADHLLYRFPDRGERGCWEVFTMLSALAAVTSRITLGPLVTSTSFRAPALVAKMADTLDEISQGRFILGLGAGWHQPEYAAFGYPFDHRASRFAEAVQIIAPLLRHGQVDFGGQYYQARNCVLRPRGPSPAGPPIWIGASQPRMLHLVAQYADAWHPGWHLEAAALRTPQEQLHAACTAVGRNPTTILRTAGTMVNLRHPGEAAWLNEAISGTPEEIAGALRAFADVGIQHLIVMLDPSNVAGVERFAPVVRYLRAGP